VRISFPHKSGGNRDQLWATLEEGISKSCVAVLGLAGKHSHWTVAARVTPLSIRLSDSGQLRALPRARCTVRNTVKRHQIPPTHVILIERICWTAPCASEVGTNRHPKDCQRGARKIWSSRSGHPNMNKASRRKLSVVA